MYGSFAAASRSSEALPSNEIPPSLSMMNSASSAFFGGDLSKRSVAVLATRHVLGDEERVAQLVRDDDGADPLEVAQLHDLFVDGQRP